MSAKDIPVIVESLNTLCMCRFIQDLGDPRNEAQQWIMLGADYGITPGNDEASVIPKVLFCLCKDTVGGQLVYSFLFTSAPVSFILDYDFSDYDCDSLQHVDSFLERCTDYENIEKLAKLLEGTGFALDKSSFKVWQRTDLDFYKKKTEPPPSLTLFESYARQPGPNNAQILMECIKKMPSQYVDQVSTVNPSIKELIPMLRQMADTEPSRLYAYLCCANSMMYLPLSIILFTTAPRHDKETIQTFFIFSVDNSPDKAKFSRTIMRATFKETLLPSRLFGEFESQPAYALTQANNFVSSLCMMFPEIVSYKMLILSLIRRSLTNACSFNFRKICSSPQQILNTMAPLRPYSPSLEKALSTGYGPLFEPLSQ